MENLSVGDRVRVTFEDTPCDQITATISRMLSDRQEGLGPEIEVYIATWLEISPETETRAEVRNVLLMTDGRYSLDGRFVTIHKISGNEAAGEAA